MSVQVTRRGLTRSTAVWAFVALALSMAACGGSPESTVAEDCTPEHEFSTVTEGHLTVSTYEYPPHTMLTGDGLSGVEGDLLTEIAERECLTLTVDSAGGASAAVLTVQSGRSDLAAADWYRTEARTKIVTLSDPIYLDQGALVSTAGYQSIDELEGKKTGAPAGSLWNDDFRKVFGDNFSIYQDPEAAFQDLASGRIDAVIDTVAAATYRLESAPVEGAQIVPLKAHPRIPDTARPGQVNWPTNKQNPELSEALNDQIGKLREEGFIAETLQKYGIDASAAETGEPYLL
ncbi:amino acid ABC transporter substrate-binding protein [Kocuria dechangensis]|uniref:Amino acid ABC transporter substrate-binding protein n=1 Tax=Kocuria dechangensis TaxID=1176249 RepID=A0A917M0A2_9MICC|nr:amino acid ABC transporter substrate-binding protein [Kocuria dechangensis]